MNAYREAASPPEDPEEKRILALLRSQTDSAVPRGSIGGWIGAALSALVGVAFLLCGDEAWKLSIIMFAHAAFYGAAGTWNGFALRRRRAAIRRYLDAP